MLIITLKSGIKHKYSDATLKKGVVLERLKKLEFWYIETTNNTEIYRTSEIAHIQVSK